MHFIMTYRALSRYDTRRSASPNEELSKSANKPVWLT
jgi:hypothetical protein